MYNDLGVFITSRMLQGVQEPCKKRLGLWTQQGHYMTTLVNSIDWYIYINTHYGKCIFYPKCVVHAYWPNSKKKDGIALFNSSLCILPWLLHEVNQFMRPKMPLTREILTWRSASCSPNRDAASTLPSILYLSTWAWHASICLLNLSNSSIILWKGKNVIEQLLCMMTALKELDGIVQPSYYNISVLV